jgi:hypothetical protein
LRYWWVNQNQTYRHEVAGGYLWSPKRNAKGARSPFYESMREVAVIAATRAGCSVAPCRQFPLRLTNKHVTHFGNQLATCVRLLDEARQTLAGE